MSGRSTSVAAVMRSTGIEVSRITDGWNEQVIPIHGDHTLVARISVKRGRLFYASSGEAPATVQQEIDWLCQADGIAFVVDSQRPCAELNTIQLARLRNDLWVRGVDLDDVPVVFQANKRDLPNPIPMSQIQAEYKTRLSCVVESIATRRSERWRRYKLWSR